MTGSGRLLGNLKGVFKGADFRLHRAKEEGMLPTFLIYQVTRKCNSKCSFCSIWKQDSSNELTVKELDGLFSDPFFSNVRWLNLTGGEPFIRKDVVEVVRVMDRRLEGLELVAIPSNGFSTKLILERTGEMLDVLEGRRLLNVNISIDGLKEHHERNRGVPGCFDKAIASLEGLVSMAKEREGLEVGVEVVITSENVRDLRAVYRYLSRYTAHISFTPVIIGPSSYYGKPDKDMGLSAEEVGLMEEFFSWLAVKLPAYAYYFDKVLDIKLEDRGGRRTFPCLGGYKTMFMDSRGEVFPCLIAPTHLCLGNVRDEPPAELWSSDKARLMRRALKKWRFCRICTNNCDIMNNLKEETINFLWFMVGNPRIFTALMRDIGKGKMDRYV